MRDNVVDMQLQEFGDRFSEVSTELLKNIAALSPCDSFSQFNVSDLLKLSELYPHDPPLHLSSCPPNDFSIGTSSIKKITFKSTKKTKTRLSK